jgi:dihydroneopterin aldolase
VSSPRATHAAATVFVHGLVLEAEIGVNADEQGQPQPLVVDIEAELTGEPWRGFSETVNYERLAGHARMIAAAGHIGLVETFAWRLAQACLAEPHVRRVTVRVKKPKALTPAMAGVVIAAELM